MNEKFKTIVAPRSGGWSRLEEKLRQTEAEQSFELQMWKIAASVLLVVFGVGFLQNKHMQDKEFDQLLKAPAADEVLLDEGEARQVPGTPDGVRIYWMFK